MAPEFFPFIAFFGLAILALFGLIGGIICIAVARYPSCDRRSWRRKAIAILSGAFIILLMLLFLGWKIRQQFFLNEPFVTACADGNIEQAEKLLANGTSPDAYGIDYTETTLIAAAKNGHIEVVNSSLSHGANVKLRSSRGKTALQCARESGSKDIAAMLERRDAR